MKSRKRFRLREARPVRQALATVLLILALSAPAKAQRIEPSIGIGLIGLDATHLALTGSTRIYLIRGLSFDPEVLHIRGSNDRGAETRVWQFGPGVAYTLRQGRIAPYVIFSPHFGRLHRTFDCRIRCVFPESSFTWKSGSAGGGVRLRSQGGFFISPEFRALVDEGGMYFRATANVGFTF